MDKPAISLHRLWSRLPPLRPGRFGWGTAQLTGATLVSRAIGFVYSAAVMRLAGPEAVGLFRMAWPLYSTAFTLATSGIPYAMAKLVAEQSELPSPSRPPGAQAAPLPHRGGEPTAVAVAGLALLAVTSVTIAGLLWAAAPWLVGRLAGEPRAVEVLRLLAPSLLLATLASGGRALFEGVRRMAVPAISLVVEQAVLSGLAVLMTMALARRDPSADAAARALAVASVVGEAAGLVVLAAALNGLWAVWRSRAAAPPRRAAASPRSAPRAALAAIGQLALPVATGRVLTSLGAALHALVLPARLQKGGLDPSQAAAQIGLLRGVAQPIVLLPNMLSVALMTTLVPSVSQALARGRREHARTYSDKALATTVLFALPITALLVSVPEGITRLLYGEAQAAPLLATGALSAPFVYLGQTLVGVLRGAGRPEVPVQAHLLGLAVDTALTAYLVARPSVGIMGAAWASVAGALAAWLVNQLVTLRVLGSRLSLRAFAWPALGAVAGAAAARGLAAWAGELAVRASLSPTLADGLALACAAAALAVLYGACLLRCPLWRWLVQS